jgi:hypothetical protein
LLQKDSDFQGYFSSIGSAAETALHKIVPSFQNRLKLFVVDKVTGVESIIVTPVSRRSDKEEIGIFRRSINFLEQTSNSISFQIELFPSISSEACAI